MVGESWRKTGRCRCWWRYRKNLGTKILPRYGRVHVDCRARLAWRPSRSSRRRHTMQRHRQQRWLRQRPEEKQIVAVVCEVRETILFAKNTATIQLGSCRSARHTRWRCPLLAGRSTVVAKTRCRSAVRLTCSYANQRQTTLADWTAETECLYKSTERAQCHCEQQYACLLP